MTITLLLAIRADGEKIPLDRAKRRPRLRENEETE